MQQKTLLKIQHSWQKDSVFLLFILGGLFFFLLGIRPLFVPDEGRYAEIAREMALTHDYVTPYLNYIKYFEKPPLFYWLSTFAIHVGGLNLWALRSTNALLGLLGCFFTYLTARKLYDRNTGFLAAIILGTSSLYFGMLNMINLDMTVTFFLTCTFYSFLLGTQTTGPTRRYYFLGASIAAALAVLTKGLIGIVFPLMIISTWLTLTHQWRSIKTFYLPSCLLIFLLIATPWHVFVSIRNPEFFYFYFVTQQFLRYATLSVGHYQPFWYFIPCLIIGFFPWIAFAPFALIKQFKMAYQHKNQTTLFLLLWFAFIFIFFSFSKSKLISYILPVFPPLAILTAHYLSEQITLKANKTLKISCFLLILLSAVIFSVFTVFAFHIKPPQIQARVFLTLGSALMLLGSLFALYFIEQKPKQSIAMIASSAWLFLLLSLAAVPSIDTRSILPLAKKLEQIAKPENEIVVYGQYYQDLPFYLQRRVSVAAWENELKFGATHQPSSDWILDEYSFWKKWTDMTHRVFVLTNKSIYKDMRTKYRYLPFYLVAKEHGLVLVVNRPY